MIAISVRPREGAPCPVVQLRPGAVPTPTSAPVLRPPISKRTASLDMHSHQHLRKDLVALLPRLRRFAVSLTRNTADADDLVQETCIRAISSGDTWDSEQGLDRWVFRILRNLWISELRKRQVRLGAGHIAADETDELSHETTGEHHLALKQLMGRLADLPSGYASVLLLVAVEGYSYREAADMLDVPQGTIMSRLFRARQLLASQLATKLEDV
jgi:RNA polymerase sigma-70 factor, ECF subfamily